MSDLYTEEQNAPRGGGVFVIVVIACIVVVAPANDYSYNSDPILMYNALVQGIRDIEVQIWIKA